MWKKRRVRSTPWKVIDDWIPIQVLVDAALRRPGLSESGGMGRTLATALPTLMLEGRYQPGNGGDNYDAGLSSSGSMMPGTTRDRNGNFFAMARLQWTPVGRKQSSTQDMDGGADTNNIWVMVDGTEVVVGDGSSPWVMSQTVSRGVVTYRNRLASDVTDLYFARADLLRARPMLASDSVLEQVELELKLDELEARLDFLTAGAVGRWYTSQNQ